MPASQAKLAPTPTVVETSQPAQDTASRTVHTPVEWSLLVAQVKAGEDAGMEQLY